MYHIHSDKRVSQSVGAICQALDQLLLSVPYRQISVTALATQAKVSKATFYRSFDTIDDVLRLQTDEVVQQMMTYLMERRSHPSLKGEMSFFLSFFRFWTAHSQIAETLIATGTTDLLTDAFGRALARHMDFFRQFIHIDAQLSRYFVATRAATLSAVLICWLKEDPRPHPDEMPQLIAQLIRPAGLPHSPCADHSAEPHENHPLGGIQ